ncbi:DUF4116 domain-containing protein [Candidatus Gracilibacteria bacterium]|nr:DUF4116 domain-containing protein [Candidatus Gracilibacteria bacterium]
MAIGSSESDSPAFEPRYSEPIEDTYDSEYPDSVAPDSEPSGIHAFKVIPEEVSSAVRNRILGIPSLKRPDEKKIFQEYRRLALGAVRMDGMVLENYPGLWDDKEIVIAAIRQNTKAFAFASDRLKDDEEVFTMVLNITPLDCRYGSKRLQNKYQQEILWSS